eukprot:m.60891 g.60891  ORF g.60891 m.60891 type:complete len:192 (+) comp13150_c4_seq1:221-796(+)
MSKRSAEETTDDRTTKKPTEEKQIAEWEKVALPAEHHFKLEPMVGIWDAHLDMYNEEGKVTMTMEGTMVQKWMFDGRYLRGTWTQKDGQHPFEGELTLTFNNIRKRYESTWVDTMGTGLHLNASEGVPPAAEPFAIEYVGEKHEPDGKVKATKSVYTFVTKDHHTDKFYRVENGKSILEMSIDYNRVAQVP